MNDKDFLKKILGRYEISQAKERDISATILIGQNEFNKIVHKKISLWELTRDQLMYVSRLLWATQLLAVILTVILSSNFENPPFQIREILFKTVPLLTIFAVPELIKSVIYGMSELENACMKRATKVLTARLLVIGCVNLVVITLVTASLSGRYNLPFMNVVIYGLIPFNIVNGLNLAVFDLFKVRSSFIAIAVSLGSATIVNAATYFKFFYKISELTWIIIFLITSVLLLIEMFRFMHSMTNKEEYVQWS